MIEKIPRSLLQFAEALVHMYGKHDSLIYALHWAGGFTIYSFTCDPLYIHDVQHLYNSIPLNII